MTTQVEQKQRDLNRKLTLEFRLIASLVAFDRKAVEAFVNFYVRAASIIDLTRYKNLEVILQRHYKRIGNVFKDDLRVELDPDVGIEPEEVRAVNKILEFSYAERTAQQSRSITQGMQAIFGKSLKYARRDFPMANHSQIATVAGA